MDSSQPQQAIEPGRIAPEINGEEANPEESHNMMFAKKRQVQALLQGPLMGHQMEKGNMYQHWRVEKDLEDKLSLLTEMKETMNTLKALASDTSSKEILDFLKEESQRQAARDDAFLKIMGALVQQPHPVVTSTVIPLCLNLAISFDTA